ncbi:MAG: GspE/PulE family protein [Deltaproteobacteria bacterium]|nr:GspE/PulE family protein [Deltaproteobacteria bacterium]
MSLTSEKISTNDTRLQNLQAEVGYRRKLQEIGNRIHSALNLDEILVHLKDEIIKLFDAERITIYVIDKPNQELVSRYKSGHEIAEIRIPVSPNSIAGFSAFTQKLIRVKNVYDDHELAGIDPCLRFDRTWDQKSGYVTRQVLACPIAHHKELLGVIQLINRNSGGFFISRDEQSIHEIGRILGIAFFNQKRMSNRRHSKFDYLIDNSVLTRDELRKVILDARQGSEPIESVLHNQLKIPKQTIGRSLSQFFKVPFVEFNPDTPVPDELLSRVKVPFMRHNVWVPLRIEDGKIVVAMDNPSDLQKTNEIKSIFNKDGHIHYCVALQDDIFRYIDLFTHAEKQAVGIEDILSRLQAENSEAAETEPVIGEEDSAVVQLVNKIILDAIERKASDIHIEPCPGKENTLVRIRIDGSCQIYQTIPYHYRNAVVSRIKIMADLDISEHRKPQDGKIKFKKFSGKDIEVRVATIPTQGGMEDVVLRLLGVDKPISLNLMGFSKQNLENFIRFITMPYGLVVVCGPTGSGKTTTLHSALGYINKSETKIWTVEDPVEISQKGLRQVQVKPKIGLDFAAAMRAFLRADPDVIMVGEMRDKETAKICIEASLTGHLVFSTLHTNSAPESIARLLNLGMDPFNFSDAILCILAQRLVKKLCRECKKPYHPARTEFEELVREYGQDEFYRNINIPYTDSLELYRPVGCEACNKSGYRGRMGIHELLMGTDAIKEIIQHKTRIEVLREQAIKDGMRTLKQDGIEKIFGGSCNLVEVRKVCIK